MQKEIVVDLMGAGRAGREHAANLVAFPDVRVALVCDPLIDAAQAAGKLARSEKVTASADEVTGPGEFRRVLRAGRQAETHE
jgi:predicted homoserine dehydrogenase-like protein